MKRILFVDDEKSVLDGLRRTLHKQRKKWTMEFAESGESAIEIMKERAFDVLITDMRMPGMDGAELLTWVHEHHPSTSRIVLSGYAETEAAMRAVPVAHQFLSKPCDSATLEEVVKRACGLQELLEDPRLRKQVSGMKNLPALPETYAAVNRALADPGVCVEDVAQIVSREPSLCAKVLQIVNSSFFALPQKVSHVEHAVGYLGLNLVRDLVLSEELFGSFPAADEIPGFSLQDEQQRALRTAELARSIFKARRERVKSEYAFTCGVLQDVGRLVLATQCAADFGAILKDCQKDGGPEWQVERDRLGVTQGEVGAYLLGLWGIPYAIVEAVAFRDEPTRASGAGLDLPVVLHVAHGILEERRLFGDVAPDAETILDRDLLSDRGLIDELPAWREMAAELEQAASGEEQRAARGVSE